MAEDDENSMIGYDPLAWLHEDADSVPPNTTQTVGIDNTVCNTADMDFFADTENAPMPAAGELDVEVELDSGVGELNEELQIMDSLVVENPLLDDQAADMAGNQIVLEPIQNIQNVSLLHQKLQQILDTEEKIDIDASAVTQIDTATLQLLLVLKLSAAKLQKEVNIDFPSQKFIDAAYLLGLAEMLSVDQAASGLF